MRAQCACTKVTSASTHKKLICFLLGTGRMLHPVGGAMGVTYAMMTYEGDTPGGCIISLNIHKIF